MSDPGQGIEALLLYLLVRATNTQPLPNPQFAEGRCVLGDDIALPVDHREGRALP